VSDVAPVPMFDGSQPCAGEDPEVFFPNGRDAYWKVPRAKACCSKCPFVRDCLAHALTNDVQGIWGNTTEKERRRIRRRHGIQAERIAASDLAALWDEVDRLDDGTRSAQDISTALGCSAAMIHRRRQVRRLQETA
jgi:WhiB family redox-sensing transcriptional regulator